MQNASGFSTRRRHSSDDFFLFPEPSGSLRAARAPEKNLQKAQVGGLTPDFSPVKLPATSCAVFFADLGEAAQ